MQHRTCWRLLLTTLVLLLTSSPGSAEFVQWRFDAFPAASFVISDNNRLGEVLFTPTAGEVVGSTRLVLANLFAFSGAPATHLDRFTHRPFTITLAITDIASKVMGKTTFTGVIDGTDSLFGSLLTFRLTSPAAQRLHLGQHIYDIRLDNITPPGPPNSSANGSIGATVLVSHNPEPSSLILAGVGTLVFVLGGWRSHGRRLGRKTLTPQSSPTNLSPLPPR